MTQLFKKEIVIHMLYDFTMDGHSDKIAVSDIDRDRFDKKQTQYVKELFEMDHAKISMGYRTKEIQYRPRYENALLRFDFENLGAFLLELKGSTNRVIREIELEDIANDIYDGFITKRILNGCERYIGRNPYRGYSWEYYVIDKSLVVNDDDDFQDFVENISKGCIYDDEKEYALIDQPKLKTCDSSQVFKEGIASTHDKIIHGDLKEMKRIKKLSSHIKGLDVIKMASTTLNDEELLSLCLNGNDSIIAIIVSRVDINPFFGNTFANQEVENRLEVLKDEVGSHEDNFIKLASICMNFGDNFMKKECKALLKKVRKGNIKKIINNTQDLATMFAICAMGKAPEIHELSEREELPESIVECLSRNKSHFVRQNIAKRSDLSNELFLLFGNDKSSFVRRDAAMNKMNSVSNLLKLCKDNDSNVNNKARRAYKKKTNKKWNE